MTRERLLLSGVAVIMVFLLAPSFIGRWRRNVAMAELSTCVVGSGWISYADRPNSPSELAAILDQGCLTRAAMLCGENDVRARIEQLRGDLAWHQGAWRGAVTHYERAASLLPKPSPEIATALVDLYARPLHRSDIAEAVLREALRSSPDSEMLRVRAAEFYLFWSGRSDAREVIRLMRPEAGEWLIASGGTRAVIVPQIVTASAGVLMNVLGARFFGLKGVVAANIGYSSIYLIWLTTMERGCNILRPRTSG